jgi:hypothetical protein
MLGVEIKDKYPEKQFCTFQLKFSPNIDSVKKTTEMILFISTSLSMF